MGGILVYIFDDITPVQNAAMLGFAGGVMITLSLLDMIVPVAIRFGVLSTAIAFTVGYLLTVAISRSLSDHEVSWDWLQRNEEEDSVLPLLKKKRTTRTKKQNTRLLRSALLTTIALAVHNAPEGVAVGLTVLSSAESNGDGDSGHHEFLVVLAIALHNIPEGIAVAAALLQATNRRAFSCIVAGATGLVEPLSAALAVLLLESSDTSNHETVRYISELMLAGVAGVMFQVSLSELIPQARAASPKAGNAGLVLGAFAVVLSLYLLGDL